MSERRGLFGRRRAGDDGPRAGVKELLPYLFPKKGLLTGAIVLSVFGAAFALAQPVLVQEVIARVEDTQPLEWLPLVLVLVVVIGAVSDGFQHFLLQLLGEHVVLRTRRTLVGRMLRLPIPEFDARRVGDLVSRVGSDTTLLRAVLTQGLVESIGGLLTLVGAVVAMLIIDPLLLGLTVLVLAVAIAAMLVVMPLLTRASGKAQEEVGHLTSALERAISAVRTVRAAGATEREVDGVGERAGDAFRAGVRVAKISAFVVPILGVAVNLSFLVVLGVGGLRVATGELDISQLVGFLLFLFLMVMPLGQLAGAIAAVSVALGALGRIQEIVRLPSEADADADVALAPQVGAPMVAFEGVTFAYPAADDERVVLEDVSFSVPAGSRTALVGPSGAGKSTTFALVERFYDVTGGSVRVGGVDVRDVDRDSLRARIGYVEQDAPVLAGTLRDNLRLGASDASDEQLLTALDSVNLGGLVSRAAKGLGAEVGEGGVLLSGGERQRLAIARALLASTPILLLDESTANLDARNEAALKVALDVASEGRTTLVIAHRLATVVDADQIVVLDGGQVLATGTHAELLESSPLYRELATHQLLAPAPTTTVE
ncbi:ABC transporter ATP-binding protein [Agrococcus sp. ARC_14]|uniref:ABC transporter ATP-binding protein n=1 Tax=Agrococcus sp. ARC_14 TaxID=2919927 RepID=UPI001F055939|nr:ABC transporter ATP-binding protein [Agrococcus sp. ARC_14]MCH1882252.1 ABC transporter ATP-binding protein/permease [Agrococcus sp. ARC_14]